MFNTISWQSYWTSLALILAIYYLVVYLLYYRSDVKLLFKGAGEKDSFSFRNDTPEFQQPPTDTEEQIVYSCIDELNAFFEEAKRKRWIKAELMHSLQLILKKYPSLQSSKYKASINTVLTNQCEHICNIHLSAEEVKHVWLGSE
jgi:hypothetical protein